MKFKRNITCLACLFLAGLINGNLALAATTADIVFVVDESGSMSGEHAWLTDMVTTLDTELNANGVTGNRFAVFGFGGSRDHLDGHEHPVGGATFGNAAQAATTFGTLLTSGGTEDGYAGMNAAFQNNFRSNAAINFILVTDEDRDIVNSGLNYAGMKNLFTGKNALLNAVVSSRFTNSAGENALGVDSKGNSYTEDGAGGFTSGAGGSATSGSGSTIADYVDLAFDVKGAAWDLRKLRAGGATADSFTKAFINIKVDEIVTQPPSEVPLPAALPLFSIAVAGLGFLRRKKK